MKICLCNGVGDQTMNLNVLEGTDLIQQRINKNDVITYKVKTIERLIRADRPPDRLPDRPPDRSSGRPAAGRIYVYIYTYIYIH